MRSHHICSVNILEVSFNLHLHHIWTFFTFAISVLALRYHHFCGPIIFEIPSYLRFHLICDCIIFEVTSHLQCSHEFWYLIIFIKWVKVKIWQYFVIFSIKMQILRDFALFNRKLAISLKMCITILMLVKAKNYGSFKIHGFS